MRHLRIFLFAVLWIQLGLGCGEIPNAPNSGLTRSERTYVDTDWGFQITPLSQWGLSAQRSDQQQAANGKPLLEVRIFRSRGSVGQQFLFDPTLYLMPQALSSGVTLDSLVTVVETDFQARFRGYRPDPKQRIRVGSEEAVEWTFRMSNFATQDKTFPGSRFLATVVVHNREWYFMLGNGEPGDPNSFPVAEYRQIVSSLAFFQ